MPVLSVQASDDFSPLVGPYYVAVCSSERGILLLDEVSTSADHEAERMKQDIISTGFEHYTVVAVSQCLDVIMDFRILVMDYGEIVKIGNRGYWQRTRSQCSELCYRLLLSGSPLHSWHSRVADFRYTIEFCEQWNWHTIL